MYPLNASTAGSWLNSRLRCSDSWQVTELPGGVSNTVLYAQCDARRLIVKQALPRLKVAQEWLADPARVRSEADALRSLAALLPPGSTPELLFEAPDDFAFAMTCAPAEASTWKQLLFARHVDCAIAAAAGRVLGSLISAGRRHPELLARFSGQRFFEELRLHPYYATTATAHPARAAFFESRIEACRTRRYSLVHGDYSPKNILVAGAHITVIDWEVIHAGDPSFDAAFLTNHLMLKSFVMPELTGALSDAAQSFWTALLGGLPQDALPWFESEAMLHLPALMLARVDGKSPAEYLTTPEARESVRRFAFDLMSHPVSTCSELIDRRRELP